MYIHVYVQTHTSSPKHVCPSIQNQPTILLTHLPTHIYTSMPKHMYLCTHIYKHPKMNIYTCMHTQIHKFEYVFLMLNATMNMRQ